MMKVILALGLLMLGACSSTSRPLPVAEGPVRQLNVGYWTATANDLTEVPK